MEILLSAGFAERAGVISGSYSSANIPCVNFEIHTNGHPRIYWIDNSGNAGDYKFTTVNVCTGEWIHLAITMDCKGSKAHCYVNGVLAETLDVVYPENITVTSKTGLGGDVHSGNGQYFKSLSYMSISKQKIYNFKYNYA